MANSMWILNKWVQLLNKQKLMKVLHWLVLFLTLYLSNIVCFISHPYPNSIWKFSPHFTMENFSMNQDLCNKISMSFIWFKSWKSELLQSEIFRQSLYYLNQTICAPCFSLSGHHQSRRWGKRFRLTEQWYLSDAGTKIVTLFRSWYI